MKNLGHGQWAVGSGIAVLLLLTACADRPAPEADAPANTPATASAPADSGSDNIFDPGSVAVGDTVLGLAIAAMDVNRVFEDSVWSGTVRFRGELPLSGVYQGHFDYPEPNALCFHADSISATRIPRFAPDKWTGPGMKTWFCFTNPEGVRSQLGNPEEPRKARIIVDDYLVVRQFSDVYSTARLVRVDSIGPAATRSLRDTAQHAPR